MKLLLKQTGGLSRSPNSSKYYIQTCSPEWIKIEMEIKRVQNTRDIDIQKSQILKGTMTDKAVMIKIGDSDDLTNEYTASQIVKGLKGFIKFYCFFTCNDDFREFFKGKRLTICKGLGSSMKVIVMPYFPMGSIASYTWTPENINVLHSCLYIACLCYIDAFKMKRFIHNDFHAANILLKHTKQHTLDFHDGITVSLMGLRPWIGDFEKSVIGSGIPIDYEYFKYDIGKLFMLLPTLIPNIDRSTIYNMAIYFQNVDDICSKNSRMQLRTHINNNIKVLQTT